MAEYVTVEAYYKDMLKIWTEVDQDVSVDDVNRSLANWHAVGVYLTQIQREYETELFAAEQNLKEFEDKAFNYASSLLLAEAQSKSHHPSQRAIEARMTETCGKDLLTLRSAKESARINCESVERLRRMHDKYPQVLTTLSNNLRTDFVYSGNTGGQEGVSRPKTHKSPGASNPAGAFGVDHAVEFLTENV